MVNMLTMMVGGLREGLRIRTVKRTCDVVFQSDICFMKKLTLTRSGQPSTFDGIPS